jgi:hypothetical protein
VREPLALNRRLDFDPDLRSLDSFVLDIKVSRLMKESKDENANPVHSSASRFHLIVIIHWACLHPPRVRLVIAAV